MNEFIHTFSCITYLDDTEFKRLRDSYTQEELFSNRNKKWVFCKYAARGFRMEIIFTPYIERGKREKYERYKAELIVTPAKLIHPNEPMSKLFCIDEYCKACENLHGILEEIKKDSGVDFLDETKLKRVDVTKDIMTPSEVYSQEVIRLAKIALDKYGYNLLNQNEIEDKKEEWKDENGVFFHNDNQELQAKIYNKLEGMKINGYDTAGITGLIRFELTLKRQFMRNEKYIKEKYIDIDDLPCILCTILANSQWLMNKYMVDPLWSGAMLSKDLQKQVIRRYCGFKTDSKKYKKMIAYRRACNRAVSMENVKDNPTVSGYFKEMGISPLCADHGVEYIPSFADLINEREDEKIKRFVELFGKKKSEK